MASERQAQAQPFRVISADTAHEDTARLAHDADRKAANAAQQALDARAIAEDLRRQVAELVKIVSKPAQASPLSGQMLATFRVLALVFSTRLMLMAALVGTFVLSLLAMDRQTPLSAAITVAFALLTLFPLGYLEARTRPAAPAPLPE